MDPRGHDGEYRVGEKQWQVSRWRRFAGPVVFTISRRRTWPEVRKTGDAAAIRDKMASLGEITTTIAHEIRNPLSGFNIHLSLLDKILAAPGPLDEAARERAEGIVQSLRSASDKIGSIVRGVLELSRPSPARLRPVHLNKAVIDAVPLVREILRKGRIRLDTKLAGESLDCGADPVLVELVLLNMVTNAAQALEKVEREKKIIIATRMTDAHAVISVEDSGPGVPRECRERVFDPAFTTKKDGMGIGLSFCRRVAALHSGYLEVGESPLGGAAFRFGIPLSRAKAAAPPGITT